MKKSIIAGMFGILASGCVGSTNPVIEVNESYCSVVEIITADGKNGDGEKNTITITSTVDFNAKEVRRDFEQSNDGCPIWLTAPNCGNRGDVIKFDEMDAQELKLLARYQSKLPKSCAPK